MPQMCPNCSQDNPDYVPACSRCGEALRGLLGHNTLLEGRYRLTRVLGCGGMGAVYLAEDGRIAGRQVAVKENLDTSLQAQAQFQSEVSLMVGLNHPGLPRVSDQFAGPTGRQYMVMDYVPGETLEEVVARRGSLPETEIVGLVGRLLDILEHLHSHSVIHRDVKPGNIKLTPEGKPVLVDFGIAKQHAPGRRTQTIVRGVGSPGFAPIEQYGTGTDTRSDLYSLGAVLYYLVTGQAPPEAPDLVAGKPLTPPCQLRPDLSPHLQGVIFKAMALDPAQRYQSAAEMRRALSTPPGQVRGQQTATPRLWLVGGAVGLVTVGVIGVALLGRGGQPAPSPTSTVISTPAATRVPVSLAPTPTDMLTPTPIPIQTDPTSIPPTRIPVSPTTPTSAPSLAGKIAFYSNRDGNDEIYIMGADGSGRSRLTNDPGSDVFPALSPDGRHIAFVSNRDGNSEIYVMDADGSNQVRLTHDPAEDRLPAWSPDGTRIAFDSDRAGNLDLYVMQADGSDLMKLTDGAARAGHPTWSPDGRRIAFNSGPKENEWEIYTIAATGGDPFRLTENSFTDWSPSWSPDGNRILFLSKRPDDANIYFMKTDGSDQKEIFGGLGYKWGAVWSPDGRAIAFTVNQGEEDNIYIMRLSDGNVRQLTYDGGAYPSWSR